jgi:hypothetical protein
VLGQGKVKHRRWRIRANRSPPALLDQAKSLLLCACLPLWRKSLAMLSAEAIEVA